MGRSNARAVVLLGLAALGSGGCAQLAGIDETSGPSPDDGLSLTVERISVGSTIERAPQDLMGQTAAYLVETAGAPDGLERIDATLDPPSTWFAPLAQAMPVELTLPDHPTPLLRIVDLPVQEATLGFVVAEHPGAVAAPVDAMLSFALTSDVPAALERDDSFTLLTAGSWTIAGLSRPAAAGATMLAQAPIAFAATSSLTGRPHEALTLADTVLVLRYVGNQLQALLEVPPFAQTGTDMIAGTLTTVALDQTLDMTVDTAAIDTRFSAVRPAVTNLSMAWFLHAAPGAAVGSDLGLQLHAQGVPNASPPTITATYGNPLASRWPTVLSYSANKSRTYTPPSAALPVTLATGMRQHAAPTPGLAITLAAGLPELIEIDGLPLSTDGITIARPTAPAVVTFISNPASATLYTLELYELVPNPNATALRHRHVVTMHGVAARFAVPPSLLKPGKLYTLRARTTQGGFSQISAGDLRPDGLAFATAFHDSGVFQVMP